MTPRQATQHPDTRTYLVLLGEYKWKFYTNCLKRNLSYLEVRSSLAKKQGRSGTDLRDVKKDKIDNHKNGIVI